MEINPLVYQMMESHLNDVYYGIKDSKPFMIVESWEEIERFIYELTKEICGEEIVNKYYKNKIKRFYDGNGISEGDLSINGSYPQEILDCFIEQNIIEENMIPNFDNIINMEWGFSDEFSVCDYCGSLISRIPDSAFWTPDYFYTPYGDFYCGNCARLFDFIKKVYIEEILLNNYNAANTILNENDFINEGYTLYQHNKTKMLNSKELFEELNKKYENIIFDIVEQTPFETEWRVWIKNSDDYYQPKDFETED